MSDAAYQPLKGDATTLRSKAQHYASIADAITRSVTTLRKVHDVDSMTSKAVDEVRESANTVADDIDKAKERYAQTASALITYSYSLASAQSSADTAISHIEDKQAVANSAHTAAHHADQAADDSTEDDKATAQKHATTMSDRASDADTELAAAKKEWHDALDAKNSAAQTAITAIVEVVDGKKSNGLKDSWWDNWGSALYEGFKKVCAWAAVLSIFLGWVPFLGPILLTLAAIGAVLDLVDSVVKVATEGGSWWDVAIAAGGVALTFVGGKAFSMLAKHVKSVGMVKSIPAALKDPKAMTSLRSVAGVKKGESAVKPLMEASKFSHPKNAWGVLKNTFGGSVKDLVPKNILKPGMSFKESVQTLTKAKVLPNLNPKNFLKLNGDFLDFAKLAKVNPSLLMNPNIAVPLVGVAGYQAYQTGNALHNFTSPSTYVNSTLYGTE